MAKMRRDEDTKFKRSLKDYYDTPIQALVTLLPHIQQFSTYVEPCAGKGALVDGLTKLGSPLQCIGMWDIEPKDARVKESDALELRYDDVEDAEYIITNPPWDRKILHLLIEKFRNLKPTWLLFDADWMHTEQAVPYMEYCEKVVATGRVKWVEGTQWHGKENVCWYKFVKKKCDTVFVANHRKRLEKELGI